MGYSFQKLKFFYLLFLVCMTSFEAALLDHIMQIPRYVTRATTRSREASARCFCYLFSLFQSLLGPNVRLGRIAKSVL